MHLGTIIGRVYVSLSVRIRNRTSKLFRGYVTSGVTLRTYFSVTLGFRRLILPKGINALQILVFLGSTIKELSRGMTGTPSLGRKSVLFPLRLHWKSTVLPDFRWEGVKLLLYSSNFLPRGLKREVLQFPWAKETWSPLHIFQSFTMVYSKKVLMLQFKLVSSTINMFAR